MPSSPMRLSCACGQFQLEMSGAPIISTECHCKSCQDAAARLQALPASGPVQSAAGGTPYVLYRKDRVRFPTGTDSLAAFRLTPQSTTRRVLASCCNTPIFLEFKGGHWLSLYGHLWPKGAMPPIEIRTMTQDAPASAKVPDDVPAGALPTAGFYARLLSAWIAMGLKSPTIPVTGQISA